MTGHLNRGVPGGSGLAWGREHGLWRQTHLELSSESGLFWLWDMVSEKSATDSSDARHPHLQGKKMRTYQWRLLGKLKDRMYTTRLAHNTHRVPPVYIPCCTFEHHCIKQDQKTCYRWPIMSLRMGRTQQEALLTTFKLYSFSRRSTSIGRNGFPMITEAKEWHFHIVLRDCIPLLLCNWICLALLCTTSVRYFLL